VQISALRQALQRWLGKQRTLSYFQLQNQSKQSIFWILLLLIALFVTCILVISSLNLRFSEKVMAELRDEQLQEAFYANLDRINSQHHTLERYTDDVAVLANAFWALHQRTGGRVQVQLGQAMKEMLARLPEAHGVGIWFDATAVHNAAELNTFVYRDNIKATKLTLLTSQNLVDYQYQPWFKQYRSRTNPQNPAIFLTPTYFNPTSKTAVLTLVKPLYNSLGQPIGMVNTDWHAEKIIEMVSQIQVTPNTFAYLIDRNNRQLLSQSKMKDMNQFDKIMHHIQDYRLIDSLDMDLNALLAGLTRYDTTIKKAQLEVDGRQYALSFAATNGGMLFGLGVPRDEIDAVLSPMRRNNMQLLLLGSLIMLGLSVWLMIRIVRLMRQLQALYQDKLTKLPNRAYLLPQLAVSDSRTLILLNVDDFKEINGLFGHDCGDYVLKRLAIWLMECLKTYHTGASSLYRLSADEFAIVTPAMPVAQLTLLLQNIKDFLHQQSLLWQQQEIPLRVTQGAVVQYIEESNNYNSLMTRAEFALQQARKQQESFAIYQSDQRIEDAYEYNLLWAGYVKDALQENRILPYFQPIYDNAANRITKYECLVRMQQKDGHIANPGQFLGVARKVRLDRQLTKVMVEKSIEKFSGLELEFSINLSYADLLNDDLTRFIKQKLDETAIGSQLIFEILESDGIENYEKVKQFIEDVKSRGCRIAIDDFGTGYSNFEHLLRLNVDIIKIDGSLIRNLDKDPIAFKVTQGIVHFAKSLNMVTVAEFVHSEEIQLQVTRLGINFSQGSYFSMPRAELFAENKPTYTETSD